MWTVALYFALVAAGVVIGLFLIPYLTAPDPTPRPSGFSYYRDGYLDGRDDAAIGVWRGGPLQ